MLADSGIHWYFQNALQCLERSSSFIGPGFFSGSRGRFSTRYLRASKLISVASSISSGIPSQFPWSFIRCYNTTECRSISLIRSDEQETLFCCAVPLIWKQAIVVHRNQEDLPILESTIKVDLDRMAIVGSIPPWKLLCPETAGKQFTSDASTSFWDEPKIFYLQLPR